MGRKLKTLNRHQKNAFRAGEHRTRREDVVLYLEMAASDMPEERLEAAENLCPCHVRTSIDAVQDAVYRMLEDEDVRVRRAAWHTFEDGGVPNDPALEAIFARTHKQETDPVVRRFIAEVAEPILKGKSSPETN